jgi:hypothetical protein
MNNKFTFAMLVVAAVFALIFSPRLKPIQTGKIKDVPLDSELVATQKPTAKLVSGVNESNHLAAPSPPVGTTQSEKWKWVNAMEENDKFFSYKAPISFYGKAIDDAGNPINGVSIDLSWTDANEVTGASSRSVVTDANGLFSIGGIRGKGISVVKLMKEGYTKSLVQNVFSFNYGYFRDPYFHSPDPQNPVVYVMRKNRQGEALIVRERKEAKLESGGESKSFPIGLGDILVNIDRLPDETPNARYWKARISLPEGGLQLTTEEFPFEAPEAGYTNQFVITNGMSVNGEQGGMFYVKTPKGFGRIMVYYVPNVPWVYAESWFNPNPTSRNLEVDPNKVQVVNP